jgi:hypothetical protein
VTPEQITTGIAVLTFFGSCLAAFWWVTRAIHEAAATQKQLVEAVKTMASQIELLRIDVTQLKSHAAYRDRTESKHEGRMEQLQSATMKVIGSLQQVSGSLDAVWRTLQRLHPEVVPKRASDRG